MLNHRRGQRITWKVENGMVHFITDEDLTAGNECFNNYGPKGNEVKKKKKEIKYYN